MLTNLTNIARKHILLKKKKKLLNYLKKKKKISSKMEKTSRQTQVTALLKYIKINTKPQLH
jgi:hypothetical protein